MNEDIVIKFYEYMSQGLFDVLPEKLTYTEIQPHLYNRVLREINKAPKIPNRK